MRTAQKLIALATLLSAPAFASTVVCTPDNGSAFYIATFHLDPKGHLEGELTVEEKAQQTNWRLTCAKVEGADELAYTCHSDRVEGTQYAARLYSTGSPQLRAGVTRINAGQMEQETPLSCRTDDGTPRSAM